MKRSRRITALFLALALCMSFICIPAVYAEDLPPIPTRAELQAAGWVEETGTDFTDSGTWGWTAGGGGTVSRQTDNDSGGYLRFAASGSGGRSASRILSSAISAGQMYVVYDWKVPTDVGNNPNMLNVALRDGTSNLLALRLGRQGGGTNWRIGLYSGVSNGAADNWNGVQILPAPFQGTSIMGQWLRVGILLDVGTQLATVSIARRADPDTAPLVYQVQFAGSQIDRMVLDVERASGAGVSLVDCGIDNLWFFTAQDTPDTIVSVLPYDFLPKLPENPGFLTQSWSKIAYTNEVGGIEDLGLPAKINVVTKAGETHAVNVTWSLNEKPRAFAGQTFDPAYPGIWTFAGTIENAPGVAVNSKNVPVPMVVDLRDPGAGYARAAEWLDRGVTAVPVTGGGNLVTWRVLADEYAGYGTDIAFNVYKNGEKLNGAPIAASQNYIDNAGVAGDKYQVELIGGDGLSAESAAWPQNCMTLNLQKPDARIVTGASSGNTQNITYSPTDVAAGDTDGDGQYELIVKWTPSAAQDPGLTAQITGETMFDCYTLEGSLLWRVALGLNITSANQHTAERTVIDLDEDGKAELAMKTAVGTRVFLPGENGNINDLTDAPALMLVAADDSRAADATPVWVVPEGPVAQQGGYTIFTAGISGTVGSGALGRVSSGPEWFTVFGGDGMPVDTVPYFAPYGKPGNNWGDPGSGVSNNRSDRFGATSAYLPKGGAKGAEPYPSAIEVRGHYGPHYAAAYQLIGGKINMIWEFSLGNPATNPSYGNHNMTAADVDGDGYDEIIFGSCVLNSDGSLRWAADGTRGTSRGTHGDAMHVSVMSPYTNDFWIMTPQEGASANSTRVYNASTGEDVWVNPAAGDVGRGIAANITSSPGFEAWSSNTGVHNLVTGQPVSISNTSDNFRVYWDGDLLDELLNGGTPAVSKPGVGTLQSFSGTSSNWGTKQPPALAADLFGDWRDEVVVRTSDNDALRIYTTNIPTDYVIYTLMHDPAYRNSVVAQGNVYNQPSHLGFYLGEDIRDRALAMELPVANLRYTNAPAPVPELSKTELAMLLGGALDRLEVLNAPEGAEITWESDDLRVARVSNGYVISVSEGTANITATVGETVLTCVVSVHDGELLITNDVFPLDVNGDPIFAQMGSISKYEDGDPYYYWYGMNFPGAQSYYNSLKQGRGTTGSTSWRTSSIRCYKSLNLVDWEPVGGPWAGDDSASTHDADVVRPGEYNWTTANVSTSWIARMGVGYNKKTGKYVMVGQYQEGAHGTNRLWYAVSDKPEGPFEFVKHEQAMTVGPDIPTRADGTAVPYTGDMTMYYDREAGEMYINYCINGVTVAPFTQAGSWEIYPERDQQYVARLNPDDFLSVVSNVEVYDAKKDTYYNLRREGGREANCMFKYNGWYYYAASGLRGWNTSPTFYMGGAKSPTDKTFTNEVGLPNNMTPMRGSSANFSHTTQVVGFVTADTPKGEMVLEFGDRWSNNAGYGIGYSQFAPISFLDPATAAPMTADDLPKTPNPKSYNGNKDNPALVPNPWGDMESFFPFLPEGYPYKDGDGNPEWKRPEWEIPVYNSMSQFRFDIEAGAWAPGPNNNYLDNPYFENDRLAGGLSMTFQEQTISMPGIQTYVNEPNGWKAEHLAGQVAQINYGGNRSSAQANRNYQLIAPGTTNQTYYSAYAGNYTWYHGYTKRNTGDEPYKTKTSQVAKNLPNGTYTFYGWFRSSGGQNEAYMYAGDAKVSLNAAIGEWTLFAVEGVEVTGGQLEVGFYSDAAADQWLYIDDVALIKTADMEPVSEITSVEIDSRITYLVTGCDANIPVTVTAENPDGLDVYVALYHDGELISEDVNVVDGKAKIFAEKIAHSEGVYVGARFAGGEVEKTAAVAMKAITPAIWIPVCEYLPADECYAVIFAEKIAPAAKGGYALTVNGVKTAITASDEYRIMFKTAPDGNVKISGVKYPELFPSYSFTFTVMIG